MQMPKPNEDLAEADKIMSAAGTNRNKKILNINATIVKPQVLVDEVEFVTARQESAPPQNGAASQANARNKESPDEFADADDDLPF